MLFYRFVLLASVGFLTLLTSQQANASVIVLFADFEDREILTVEPVISGSDIGDSWDNSMPGG